MFRIAPAAPSHTEAKVDATPSQSETGLGRETREVPAPAKRITDEQIASAIRYLDPDPGTERSDDDGTILVICFSLLILLMGALAIVWLYLRTFG